MSQDPADEALAHAHIASLLSRYYQAIDAADWKALDGEVLVDDSEWTALQRSATGGSISDTVTGRQAILEWFEKIMGGDAAMSEGTCRHFISTHVITVEGTTARSRSHLQAFDTRTMGMLSNGVAEAEYVKTDRGWRIRRYRVDEDITDADMAAFKAAVPR